MATYEIVLAGGAIEMVDAKDSENAYEKALKKYPVEVFGPVIAVMRYDPREDRTDACAREDRNE